MAFGRGRSLDDVELVAALVASDAVTEVLSAERELIYDRLAKLIDVPDEERMRHWWWKRARRPFFSVVYAADLEFSAATWNMLTLREVEVDLTITDTTAPSSWRTFGGPPSALFAAIRDAPLVEFFITPRSGTWVAFDMHHDCILLAGWCGSP